MVSSIRYSNSADGVTAEELAGFFVGWPQPPDLVQRKQILQAAHVVVIARDERGTLIGFITALTDGMFAAHIPLLEVLPERQREGVGRALVELMLDRLSRCYMIDVACDDDVVAFYQRLGATRLNALAWRNPDRLAGPS